MLISTIALVVFDASPIRMLADFNAHGSTEKKQCRRRSQITQKCFPQQQAESPIGVIIQGSLIHRGNKFCPCKVRCLNSLKREKRVQHKFSYRHRFRQSNNLRMTSSLFQGFSILTIRWPRLYLCIKAIWSYNDWEARGKRLIINHIFLRP